jgi:integrase
MKAAATLEPALRAATYETIIGLLAVSGMRVGEAISLDRDDVDWVEGLLRIRHAKFDKHREVPLHPSTMAALATYGRRRDAEDRSTGSRSFFVSSSGTRLSYSTVRTTFVRLLGDAGLEDRPRLRPRLHDLRHSFAMNTLAEWHRAGGEVDPRLPQLSTYLGHVDPKATYWYLHATPELMAAAAARLEAGGVP